MTSLHYYGETTCQGKVRAKANGPCSNKAYWEQNGGYLCGVHATLPTRTPLPINPNKALNAEAELKKHWVDIEAVALVNRSAGKPGQVTCYKMKMLKVPGFEKGFINIFPNFKHGNRKDGLGLPSLSPKSIGPIKHGQPGLPVAINLENFHQGNKVFPDEVDQLGEPTPAFFKTQRDMYTDPIPHRHKDNATASSGTNKNIPLYSVWVLPDGTKTKIDYFTSRQFYCNYYERFVKDSADYKMLQQKLKDGYNLRICGFDGYDVTASVEACYLDIARPFGHELVLYTMLTEDQRNYPWRKYKTFTF